MAFALGSALMARDIPGERRDLEDEERRLQKASEKAVKAQQKKGMWGSIGKTLGSIGAGALGTALGGPAGGVLAAKMVGGYLGGRLGQGAVDTSKELAALRSQAGGGKFLTSQREDLLSAGKDLQGDFRDARSGMRNQLAMSSVASPLMAYGAAEGLGGFGKDALLASGDKMSAWDALISQSEFSPFMGGKEKAGTEALKVGGSNPLGGLSSNFGGVFN